MDNSKAHSHAATMAQYAQDAAASPEPWLNWQFQMRAGYSWLDLGTHPRWDESTQYRRKPVLIERFIPVHRLPAGALVLTEAKISREYALDDTYNGRFAHEKQVGVLRVQINPDTLTLVQASLEKLP